MATPKTKATPKAATKPKAAATNTSAPQAPGSPAEVSVPGAAQAAPQSGTEAAGQLPSENKVASPAGGVEIAKALIVSAKADGFRRAGRRWTTEAQTVAIDEFSQEQIEALLAEPMLDVVVVAE